MSSVVIQHIHTTWTKQSRGGDGARRRSSVPEAVKLPSTVLATPYILHQSRFDEGSNFRQTDLVKSAKNIGDLNLKDLELKIEDNQISVRYHRDHSNAAKEHPHPYSDVFTLNKSEWGQLTFNGRFTDFDTGQWSYEKSTYNIGLFPEIVFNRFVATQPDYRYVELAKLW
ncbi:MAG: hypothetical protein COA78_19330 [Blastopirellula sp.]|nr:MAG: hypothetical protein COA78_19330 [Blastopirellula sp.]